MTIVLGASIPRPGPDGRVSVRELQAAFQSVNKDIATVAAELASSGQGTTGTVNLLALQVNQMAALVTTLVNRIVSLEAALGTYLAAAPTNIGDPMIEVAPGAVQPTTDNIDMAHRAFVGLAAAQAATGQRVRVVDNQIVTVPTWNWDLGPVYLDDDGTLTQNLPTGVPFIVGVAVAPTSIQVNPGQQGIEAVDNLGTGGFGILDSIFNGTLYAKSLYAGANIEMESFADGIEIRTTGGGGGGPTSVSNLGTGAGVLAGISGSVLNGKSLTAGQNVSVTASSTEIEVSSNRLLADVEILAACTSYTISGLDLQASSGFLIEAAKDDSVTCSITVAVNGSLSSSDYENQYIYAAGVALSALRQSYNMFLVYSDAGAEGYGWGEMSLTPSGIVVMSTQMVRGLTVGGGTIDGGLFMAQSLFTVSNVTSITFQADVPNGIGVGTRFRIFSKQ